MSTSKLRDDAMFLAGFLVGTYDLKGDAGVPACIQPFIDRIISSEIPQTGASVTQVEALLKKVSPLFEEVTTILPTTSAIQIESPIEQLQPEIAPKSTEPPVNCDLTIEEAKKIFPHFTAAIEEGKEIAAPAGHTVDVSPAENSAGYNTWDDDSKELLCQERTKNPPTSWKEIGTMLGRTGTQCQAKHISIMKKTATAAPVAISKEQDPDEEENDSQESEYAGKRDSGQLLTDEDWPSIQDMLRKKHTMRAIASDYDVPSKELRDFVDRKLVEDARAVDAKRVKK